MKTHILKLEVQFCDAVLNGEKTFELRFNDRQFQKGDRIRFKPVLSGPDPDYPVSYQCGFTRGEIKHPIMDEEFEITYVLTGWGLQDGYAALSIRKIKEAALAQLDELEAVDAVPVVHGEWEETDDRWGVGKWRCSACEKHSKLRCDYCPNCGAKMKGENDETDC